MEFKITGIVREKESKRPVPGLLVRGFDKDLFYTDLLGNAITGADGSFSFGYEGKDFQELFDKRPDIYLVIYGSESAGNKPIFTTKNYVRFNAGRLEHFEIEISREELGPDAPGMGIVPPPQPGEWKNLVDEHARAHPVDFQYNPEKGFSSPNLYCTSNFAPEITNIAVGDSGWVTVRVTNKGNGVSFSTYVEVYEGPRGYNHPLRDYRLCDYRILTVNSQQTVDVKLFWTRQLKQGRIVGVCFDPFLDPRGFHLVEQYNRHITSIHYRH